MASCGCSVVKSKATGRQEPLTPTEPNWTQKPAVINYGDKQHFWGMEPTNGVFLCLKKRGLQDMLAHEKVQQQGERDYRSGVPLNRNPWQYTSNVSKQAAWAAGWNKAAEKNKMNKLYSGK